MSYSLGNQKQEPGSGKSSHRHPHSKAQHIRFCISGVLQYTEWLDLPQVQLDKYKNRAATYSIAAVLVLPWAEIMENVSKSFQFTCSSLPLGKILIRERAQVQNYTLHSTWSYCDHIVLEETWI